MAQPDELAENQPVEDTLGGAADEAELSAAVAALTDEGVEQKERRRLLGRLVRLEIRERGVKDLFRPKKAIAWITDSVTRVAPYIPVRDLDTLIAHHGGLTGDALAERLIRNASRVTAGIGAAGGGVAAVEWAVTPSLLSAPVLLAAETVAVVAVEMKLIGELHAVYGRPVDGTERAVVLIQAWAERRGVNPLRIGGSVAAAMGTALRKELRDRLLKRFGRNLSTLGPLLTGAAVGGFLNRRATLSLGADIKKDLQPGRKVIEG
ncbi:hypothetical protein [Dactylosporangium sp. NPDC000521]|uniref:hypothetical protein n=1 Tax=Dactylosporangium sp. NPDC000521 TaxID=3363975 RepID=UPI0036785E93